VVATEDSDLLAFGVEKVFFKMDPEGFGKFSVALIIFFRVRN
jgi:hypothetical protein